MDRSPLEIALTKKANAMCLNCKKRTVVNGVNYCSFSGKVILEMHLDSSRSDQCKDIWEGEE